MLQKQPTALVPQLPNLKTIKGAATVTTCYNRTKTQHGVPLCTRGCVLRQYNTDKEERRRGREFVTLPSFRETSENMWSYSLPSRGPRIAAGFLASLMCC